MLRTLSLFAVLSIAACGNPDGNYGYASDPTANLMLIQSGLSLATTPRYAPPPSPQFQMPAMGITCTQSFGTTRCY